MYNCFLKLNNCSIHLDSVDTIFENSAFVRIILRFRGCLLLWIILISLNPLDLFAVRTLIEDLIA